MTSPNGQPRDERTNVVCLDDAITDGFADWGSRVIEWMEVARYDLRHSADNPDRASQVAKVASGVSAAAVSISSHFGL